MDIKYWNNHYLLVDSWCNFVSICKFVIKSLKQETLQYVTNALEGPL